MDDQQMFTVLLHPNVSEQESFLSAEECENQLHQNFTNSSDLENNTSCLPHAPVLNNAPIIKGTVLCILAILSCIGNLATMYSIHKSRRRRSAHIYTLLYHLSIADLFVTFWCILGDAIWYFTVEWKLGNIACKLFKFMQMFSLYLSTFIMVLIGVDRFRAVKYPLKSMSREMCSRLILFCWVLSAVLSSPQILIFNVQRGPFQEVFFQCVTYGVYTYEWQEQLYTLFTLAFTFILPLAILATTYLLTVCTLHSLQNGMLRDITRDSKENEDFMEHTGTIRSLIDPNRRKIIRRAKMKSLRISVAIVVAFVICWTPYYASMIYTFIRRKDESENPESLLFTIIFFFGVCNSLVNPVIFWLFHRKPRRKELQRGHSSRKTVLTNVSFHRQRPNGALITNGISVIARGEGARLLDLSITYDESKIGRPRPPNRQWSKTSETYLPSEDNTKV